MLDPLRHVAATPEEVAASRPGDGLVDAATVVMDRGFDLAHPPATVWPWLVQLGKRRAGWYLPRPVERLVPRGRRALRRVDPRWQRLAVGDVIPDYGGRDATFEVAALVPPAHLLLTSRRGGTGVSWLLHLTPYDGGSRTRVHLRLRLGPVRHARLAETLGGAFDALTILGLATGLAERLDEDPHP